MATTNGKRLFYNLILCAVILIALALSLLGYRTLTSVALEQPARCGRTEHLHTADCYIGEVLICTQKAHTHDENCYLVLLRDNDLNWLLQTLETAEGRSLNGVISGLMGKILPQSGLDTDGNILLSAGDIQLLNDLASADGLLSKLVFNGSLDNGAVLTLQQTENGMTTLAADPSDGQVGMYIYLDGSWLCLKTLQMTSSSYSVSVRRADVIAAYAAPAVIVSSTALNDNLYYSTTHPANLSSTGTRYNAASDETTYTFSTFISGNSPRYFSLYTSTPGKYDWSPDSYTPIGFHTVTLDYSAVGQTNQVQYVQSGLDSTLSLSDAYTWKDKNGNIVTADALKNITATTTLYASQKSFTVTYKTGNTSETVTATGGSHTVRTPPEGCFWKDEKGNYYTGGETLSASCTLTAVEGYVLTLRYRNGTVKEVIVEAGAAGTLPSDIGANNVWLGSDGKTYNAGAGVTPSGNMTFTESPTTITITYSENQNNSVVSPATTQTVSIGQEAKLHTMEPREFRTGTNVTYFEHWTSGGNNYAPASIVAWDELLALADDSNTVTMTAQWTASNTGSNTKYFAQFYIRLDSKAVDYSDSNGSNVTGRDSADYSGLIYTTHVGGADGKTSFTITDTADNSYTADQKIRRLEGEQKDDIWLYSIPTDAQVLASLASKNHGFDGNLESYTANTTIEGLISKLNTDNYLYFVETDANNDPVDVEIVLKSDLTTDNYAVRWYVFKNQSDGWHIDGRLVKKEGTIRVTKTFQGDENVMEAAKNGFYIDAECESEGRQIILKLDDSAVDGTGTETLTPTTVSDDKLSYEWQIKHVGPNELWKITEKIRNSANEGALKDYSVYSEYSVYDSSGLNETQKAEYGSEVSVEGVIQAVDEGTQHMLRADFTNYYLRKDAIALKKEDGATGKGLAGVKFEMFHVNMDEPLRFTGTPGNYTKDDNGTITQLETDASGYISIIGFSYDRDEVVFREVGDTVPTGYIQAPDITLQGVVEDGKLTNVNIIKIGDTSTEDMTADEIENDAEYHHAQQMLVVKNHTADSISVTARKEWDVDESMRTSSVTVELYANGELVTNLLPAVGKSFAVLKEENGYSYTWENLPSYIDGEKVVWSIYETQVGEDRRTLSGRFIKWLDSYELPEEIYGDDGKLEHVNLVVRNDLYRIRLAIQKTDETGIHPLPGVTFELQRMTDGGEEDTSGYNRTLTTDAKGQLAFEGLSDGYYRLTEIDLPVGYKAAPDPVYIHIDASGQVSQVRWENGSPVKSALSGDITQQSTFSLLVKNYPIDPLPETGGMGTHIYTQSGLLLMAASAALYIYKRKRRKEEQESS